MAVLIKKIFGNLSGSLGDSIFRNRYGKVIAYTKPSKQRISKSAAAKKARKQFALTVAFAKKINNLPILAKIWRNAKIPGTSAYHKIIKQNIQFTSNDCFTKNNIIVPHGGYIAITDINRIRDTITISFASAFNEFLKNFEGDVNLIVLVYLYKRRSLITPEFLLFDKTVTFRYQSFDPEIGINLKSINVPFNKYSKAIIYAAVLFEMLDKEISGYSRTFAKEI